MKLYNRKHNQYLRIIAKYIYQFIPENYFNQKALDRDTYEAIVKPLGIKFTEKGTSAVKGFIQDPFYMGGISVTYNPIIGSILLSNIYINLIK